VTARSAVHVHVTSRDGTQRAWLRPGDEVPSWASVDPALTESGAAAPSSPPAPAPKGAAVAAVPARSGKGSGVEAWRAFAAANGVDTDSDMSRDDIIDACEQAGVVPAEG